MMNSWLDRMETEDRPILVTLVVIPLETLDCYGKYIVDWVLTHLKVILISGASLFGIKLLVNVLPTEVFLFLLDFVAFSHRLFGMLTGSLTTSMIIVLLVVYGVSIVLLWNPDVSVPFQVASNALWIVILGYLCSFLGAFQVPAFIFLFGYCLVAYVLHSKYRSVLTPTNEGPEQGKKSKFLLQKPFLYFC